MNIPYFITFVNPDGGRASHAGVQADPRATELAMFGDYHVFRIAGTTGYVEVMKNEPVRVNVPQDEWRDMAVKWYLNEDALDTPIVLGQRRGGAAAVPSITAEEAASPPEVPDRHRGQRDQRDASSNESLTFDTTAIGEPHWIKISYFPNWHVKGADGPYLVSPSFMMVIPTQSHVDALLRPHGGQHDRPDPGGHRLAHGAGPERLVHGGPLQAPPSQGDGGGFGRGADGRHRCRRARLQGSGPLHRRSL